MTTRVATCSCGQLRATCAGEPLLVSMCHCLECQRRTGSAFGVGAIYERARVDIVGTSTTYTRNSDDGFWGSSHFCPICGTSVYWEIERRPGMISVALGAFADPNFPPPQRSVYGDRKHAWVEFGALGNLLEN